MDLSSLQSLLEQAPGARLLCVGDLMVDRYVHGEVARISPEAPIPVLTHRREQALLGAAGNVARNLAALGARVSLAGVVGVDAEAATIRALVAAEPLIAPRLVAAEGRRTTVKTRFVSGGQQLLRVDSEDAAPVIGEVEAGLARAVEHEPGELGAVLISDYAKGALTAAVLSAALAVAERCGAPVIVDPKRPLREYGPVDLIKPNTRELGTFTGLPTETDADVEAALAHALDGCEAKAILVTRAGEGMSLIERRTGVVRHFRARARTVFDVSGAGDTCMAALGLAAAAGAPLETAIALALLASGVAISKPGAAVVTPAELVEAELAGRLAPAEAKVTVLDGAVEAAARWRGQGLRVGFTNGCYDILHRGHVAYLNQARGWCDRLIVAVNSDASVRALKGEGRPVNALESRALVLAGLGCVDLVTAFDAPTPLALIEAIRPDVLIKGADYAMDAVVGAERVRSWGGEVRLADVVDGYSTTAAIARMSRAAR